MKAVKATTAAPTASGAAPAATVVKKPATPAGMPTEDEINRQFASIAVRFSQKFKFHLICLA